MKIPVLLYHHTNWIDKDPTLNVAPDVFDSQMRYLQENDYKTVFLDEFIALEQEGDGHNKTVAITFDDGYLDNWVYAYPILKKYCHKATIFVTTANIGDSVSSCPTLEDVWSKKVEKRNLPRIHTHFNVNFDCTPGQPNKRYGFMNWEELRRMQESGVIDVQSHSHTHGYYYISDKITGFNRMQSWAVSWPTDGDARFGIPLYERKPSLVAKRYFDDAKLRDFVSDIAKRGINSLLSGLSPSLWHEKLNKKVREFLSSNPLNGCYENNEDYAARVTAELGTSKKEIEREINKKCKYLSFPAGKHNDTVVDSLVKAGYSASFANTPLSTAENGRRGIFGRSIVRGDFEWFCNYMKRQARTGRAE